MIDENKVREIIRQELKGLLGLNSFIFEKNLQIFDGRNIHLGTTLGTKIGTHGGGGSDPLGQKLGFFGATPVKQQLKANHNNWASGADVASALAYLGLVDLE